MSLHGDITMNIFMIDLSTGATLKLHSRQPTYQTKVDTDTGVITLVSLAAEDMKAQYGSCWICPVLAIRETRQSLAAYKVSYCRLLGCCCSPVNCVCRLTDDAR